MLIDNWDGVVLYDNPGRACGDVYTQAQGASDGLCTLDSPSAYVVDPSTGFPASYVSGSATVTGSFPATVDGFSIIGDAITADTGGLPNNTQITATNGCSGTPSICSSVTISTAATSTVGSGGHGGLVTYSSCSATNLNGATSGGQSGVAPNTGSSSYVNLFGFCRGWAVRNVTVSGNTFDFNPAVIGSGCITGGSMSLECGFVGMYSNPESTFVSPWTKLPSMDRHKSDLRKSEHYERHRQYHRE